MFERTFSFWRRWVGQKSAPTSEAATAVEEDRRLWARFDTDLQGKAQLAEKGAAEKLLANVRDLSQGGANLIVDRQVRTGQMLTLELPAAHGEMHTVLACVVRATPAANGQWSLGCVFSRELTGADLTRFGAQKTQASREDQRVWVRYDCVIKAAYRKFGDPATEAKPVEVLNISASGIGLVVPPGLDSGSLINVDLFDKTGRKVCAIIACIVHTTLRASGDAAVGCNFIRELTEEELQSLV